MKELFPNKQGVENDGVNLEALQQFQYQQVTQETTTGSLDTTNSNYFQQHHPHQQLGQQQQLQYQQQQLYQQQQQHPITALAVAAGESTTATAISAESTSPTASKSHTTNPTVAIATTRTTITAWEYLFEYSSVSRKDKSSN